MADIYLAHATSEAGMERYVVLKRVIAERSKDPHLARMFLDEARLVAQLQHPNIAQVHDIGSLAGAYFFTMEYVHGEDVRHVMQRLVTLRRALPIQHALHIAAGALAGLHHAHERVTSAGKHLGVVHRDVSPANVMIAFEGVIKLLDFGVAKATERLAEESRSGTIKGKIAYLSPEQCEGSVVDRRSDIFSLGIVLHELLTGLRLFRRDTDLATMLAITQQPIEPPSHSRPEVSPAIDAIVMNALARDLNARYQTAAEMLEAIEEVATREQHALSATAMSRFMRDTFGDRPEPWVELQVRQDETRPITITSELLSLTDDPLLAATELVPKVSIEPSTAHGRPRRAPASLELEAQLDAAPSLAWPHDEMSSSDAIAIEPMRQFVSGPIRRPPTPLPLPRPPTPPPAPRTPPVGTPVLDGAPRSLPLDTTPLGPIARASNTPSEFPKLGDLLEREAAASQGGGWASTPPPVAAQSAAGRVRAPRRLRPWITIGGVAIFVIAAGIIVSANLSKSPHPAATGADELAVTLPVVSDATVAVAPPDATVAVPNVTVAAADAGVDAPTIASATAAADWETASRLCAAARPKNVANEDRVSCALAACNTKRRGVALVYYQASTRASHGAIERACRDNAISLATPPIGARPTTDALPKDPCETNPMKCRK